MVAAEVVAALEAAAAWEAVATEAVATESAVGRALVVAVAGALEGAATSLEGAALSAMRARDVTILHAASALSMATPTSFFARLLARTARVDGDRKQESVASKPRPSPTCTAIMMMQLSQLVTAEH